MNIAIVIGISNYTGTNNNLPGCKNDADVVNSVLKKTNKFQDILYVNNNETSAETKALVTSFISKHRGSSVEEMFFYYSGHGEFFNDEFYYILSDFDSKKRNQTSLQNTEVDDLIRSLEPNLLIKVIDACQSGITYIKESDVLAKYFIEKGKAFKKCYFLNSSLNEQSSYQTKAISYFTYSFVNAIKKFDTKEIRYKDIIDAISDDFLNNPDQTPFFVIQADYTERFCVITDELKDYLNTLEMTVALVHAIAEATKTKTIAEIVKQDAKNFVDKDGAMIALHLIRSEFESFSLHEEMKEIFTCKIDFLETAYSVSKKSAVNKWLEENSHEYFFEPIYSEVYDDYGDQIEILTDFDLKIDSNYKAISIDIINKYPNVDQYNAQVLFFLSKKHIRFFYFITNYTEKGWNEKELNEREIKWSTLERPISQVEEIKSGINEMVKSVNNRIENDIKEKFKVEELSSNPKTDSAVPSSV